MCNVYLSVVGTVYTIGLCGKCKSLIKQIALRCQNHMRVVESTLQTGQFNCLSVYIYIRYQVSTLCRLSNYENHCSAIMMFDWNLITMLQLWARACSCEQTQFHNIYKCIGYHGTEIDRSAIKLIKQYTLYILVNIFF